MKTAVDLLEQDYKHLVFEANITKMHPATFDEKVCKLFEKAKGYEKHQMIKCIEDGQLIDFWDKYEDEEDYYRQTYNQG